MTPVTWLQRYELAGNRDAVVKSFRQASREAQRALYGELTQWVVTGALHARIHAT